ncbi:uncharacterized protein LOC123316282 isoform X2 [Coccinella septempunctata]|uniref:uncharacterized protein LOC123316282 isoform X2 n=1 Tax=Coccinella septempunctata TaxID=41139 RepID=UPI001D06EDEA|nr:uncharacterized protein LOC123316282 isoform X2 [Coccinella septempunctata]
MESMKDLKIMPTMSKPIIEKVDEYFQQFENMLPHIEEIEFIEDYLLDVNRLTLGENPSEVIIRNAQDFNLTNTYYDISDSQQNTEKLASYRDNIEQLKNQLSTLDTEYDKMLEEKRLLEDKMSEFSTDSFPEQENHGL